MIFFIYGSDTYRSRQYRQQVVEQFKAKVDPRGLAVTTLGGEQLTTEAIRQASLASSLLGGRQLVVIEDLFAAKISEEVGAVVQDIVARLGSDDPKLNVVVFYERGVPDQRLSLVKLLAKQPRAQRFDPLAPPQAMAWAQQLVKERGAVLPAGAAQALVQAVGSESWALALAAMQLAAYKRGQTVAPVDVAELIPASVQSTIFELTDALGAANRVTAARHLERLLQHGEEPLYVLAMLVRQVRLLSLAKDAHLAPPQFAQTYKVHPFVARKVIEQSQRFSWERLRHAYEVLQVTDADLKTSSLPPALLLTNAVASI